MHSAACGSDTGERQGLVDVDADAVDAGFAGVAQDANAGCAGDLEDHVRTLIDHLVGDLGTTLGIVEADDRVRVGLLT